MQTSNAGEEYVRPAAGEYCAELEIKRSRFIALAQRTVDEAEAREFIHEVKARYPDARHHCSAFMVHVDDANPIERSSDDGEPAGTAGQPMLEVLRGSEILDITVVVVRYFGGVLLGTGGLVRAYQDATRAVLDQVQLVRRQRLQRFDVAIAHHIAGRLESEIRAAGHRILAADYAERVILHIATGQAAALDSLVARVTSGGATLQDAGWDWIELS